MASYEHVLTMQTEAPSPTPAQTRHHEAALGYAERHFSDPDMSALDAAIFQGISDRTLRESLAACGTTWRAITQNLRLSRASELLRHSTFEVAVVARLSGYRSAPALAAAFRRQHGLTPAEWRRQHGGPARAGGATGASYRAAERARALREGTNPPPRFRGPGAGDHAIEQCEIDEAHERIKDRRILCCEWGGGVSIQELAEEVTHPRHLRDMSLSFWRERAEEFDQWVQDSESRLHANRDDSPLWDKT